jgi:hypothetical protein
MSLLAQTAINRRPAATGALMLATFTAALFVSALLLFAVEPMFTKLVLPRLGGSPAVWSVAMVFFQAMLLAGYGYAHALTRNFNLRNGAIVHLVLLAATTLVLPIGVAEGWGRPPSNGQALWLIGLFAVSVGLPFFAVAATGPLLQAWFSRSGHRHAADPYFLYGASNLGSFAALILYPVLFEPAFTLSTQGFLWSLGFVGLIALIGASALLVLGRSDGKPGRAILAPAAAPGWRDRLAWTGLAFVPSALLVAVTAHISTDIAAAPFLWVIPLAIYLLTFVIAFQRRPIIPHGLALRALPIAIAPVAVLIAGGGTGGLVLIIAHLGFFFVAALACHGEMVRLRPPAGRLTEFYLWMATGGVLGGIFSGLVAPQVFSTVLEYPVLVVASLAALPGLRAMALGALSRHLGIVAALVAVALVLALAGWRPDFNTYVLSLCIAGLIVIVLRDRPAIQLGSVIGLIVLGGAYQPQLDDTKNFRSFFGVNKVAETTDGRFRLLIHGTTLHGAERIRNDDGTPYEGRPELTTYYAPGSPLDQVVSAARSARGGLAHVATVGLGTGSMACFAEPPEDWRFYEIDSEVVRIARDPTLFRFLSACTPDAPIIVGDARLTLSDEPDGLFDLIVVDAFSSDAVPVHLLTREAIAGYFAKLAPGGVLAFHISNQYMDLAPVVAASAAANGLVGMIGRSASMARDPVTFRTGSIVAVMVRQWSDLAGLAATPGWTPMAPDPTVRVWTDDYSNILSAMVRRLRAGP